MYEKYPMVHYDYSHSGTGIEEFDTEEEMIPEAVEALDTILQADYTLRGSVEVLQFFPQPEDSLRSSMHLQSFSHMHAAANYYTSRVYAGSYLLLYTESGKGRLEYEGRSFELEEGSLFWIDCRKPHVYQTAPVLQKTLSGSQKLVPDTQKPVVDSQKPAFWEHTDIHLNGTGIKILYNEFRKSRGPVLKSGQVPYYRQDIEALLDAYVTPDIHRNLRVAQSIGVFLTHLITESGEIQDRDSQKDGNLQQVVYYMQEHFREPLTMEQLAALSGFSKYHFSREFKRLTGFPPGEYLIRLRLDQAKILLGNTSLPVWQVAAMSGIENEAYFSRLFRARLGMTPGAFRSGE